jgi:hypothetical protein
VAIGAVPMLGVASGAVVAVRQADSQPAKPAKPNTAAGSPGLTAYRIPASVAVNGSSSARVRWNSQAESLPGFTGYIVYAVTAGQYRPLNSTVLTRGKTSFTVPLRVDQETCLQVAALVTKAPPGPQAQPTCVSPPVHQGS